jgi:hypothetical protein
MLFQHAPASDGKGEANEIVVTDLVAPVRQKTKAN